VADGSGPFAWHAFSDRLAASTAVASAEIYEAIMNAARALCTDLSRESSGSRVALGRRHAGAVVAEVSALRSPVRPAGYDGIE
jgi:hypothetical protein